MVATRLTDPGYIANRPRTETKTMPIIPTLLALGALSLGGLGLHAAAQPAPELIEEGRYLVKIGGCNDCHTAGYLMREGQVPEAQWLLGDRFGWSGPWGTTYATNLRLLIAEMTEAEWLAMARGLVTRPPMPWWKLHEMKEEHLRALYHYIRHLGPAGEPAPGYLPPEVPPPPPFASFPGPPP